MRVVKVVPGSGGTFYCENCMRDSALAKALKRVGHDVLLVPMYLPMYTDDPTLTRDVPVFFGGINVYLQHRFPIFRRTPRWLDRLFDSRFLLRMAARQEGSTRASGMGKMTLSMIRGLDGDQAKEVTRLTEWLKEGERPDVIHLSTVMLAGLAPALREALGCRVVCSLMDEDVWIDALDEPYGERCWEAMADLVPHVDAFMAASRYYAGRMCDRLRIPESKMHLVPVGIDLEGYLPSPLCLDPPVVGYLSKMTPSLGLGTLVEACIVLKQNGYPSLRLHAMGGITGTDRRFVDGLKGRVASLGMQDDFEFLEDVDRATRLTFLQGLSVLSVPIPGGEAYGTFMVEAWAAGVPVVQPRAGAFEELVDDTGGGVVYDGDGHGPLAEALGSVLREEAALRRMAECGRSAVLDRYGIDGMAHRVGRVYEVAVGGKAS